jgi:hypothetical protein
MHRPNRPDVPGLPGVNLPPALTPEERRELELAAQIEDRLLQRLGDHVRGKPPTAKLPPQSLPTPPVPTTHAPRTFGNEALKYAGIAGIITAFLGAGGVTAVVKPIYDQSAAIQDIKLDQRLAKDEIAKLGEECKKRNDALEARIKSSERRDLISEAVLCKHNGGRPFARGVECDQFDFDALPLDRSFGPGWMTKTTWPKVKMPEER